MGSPRPHQGAPHCPSPRLYFIWVGRHRRHWGEPIDSRQPVEYPFADHPRWARQPATGEGPRRGGEPMDLHRYCRAGGNGDPGGIESGAAVMVNGEQERGGIWDISGAADIQRRFDTLNPLDSILAERTRLPQQESASDRKGQFRGEGNLRDWAKHWSAGLSD